MGLIEKSLNILKKTEQINSLQDDLCNLFSLKNVDIIVGVAAMLRLILNIVTEIDLNKEQINAILNMIRSNEEIIIKYLEGIDDE